MNSIDFVHNLGLLADTLGKRNFTSDYWKNAWLQMKATNWDVHILKEVIQELMLENPYKVDISAGNIRSKYYRQLAKIQSQNVSYEEIKPYPSQIECHSEYTYLASRLKGFLNNENKARLRSYMKSTRNTKFVITDDKTFDELIDMPEEDYDKFKMNVVNVV